MTLGLAYCRLFKEEDKPKDTANIRISLEQLTEEGIMDCSEYWQNIAMKVDNELERLEMVQEPDQIEKDLNSKLVEAE